MVGSRGRCRSGCTRRGGLHVHWPRQHDGAVHHNPVKPAELVLHAIHVDGLGQFYD
jgi:hypothetical protein